MADLIDDKSLADKLRQEWGIVDWQLLKPHFARNALIMLSPKQDIITAGVQIASDNRELIEQWLADQTLSKPTASQSTEWEKSNPSFRSLVVAPFVLFQQLSH